MSLQVQGNKVGYSERINDPAFAKYLKNTNRYSVIFSLILALCAVIGFGIYGETSSEMDNPQAILIGLGIGVLFIGIAIFQIAGRKRSKTWNGVVIDKTSEKKKRRRQYGDKDEYDWEENVVFTVLIRSEGGKVHSVGAENDDTVFNYFQIGDQVRHHGGLNSYEKFDKSKDDIIFCNACATLHNIQEEYCLRCGCPLLK